MGWSSGKASAPSKRGPHQSTGTDNPKAFLAVRTPDGSRSLAVITDPASVQATVREDIAGVKVAVAPDGTATLR